MTGAVRETYAAALQHDMVDLSGDELLAGVVRRPTGWFRSAVDENYRELGPPDDLLARVRGGEDVALVCCEGENKQCHRHVLRERIRERFYDTLSSHNTYE